MVKSSDLIEAIERFQRTILAIENRCMAADGPVAPTLQEMTEVELAKIWTDLVIIKEGLHEFIWVPRSRRS